MKFKAISNTKNQAEKIEVNRKFRAKASKASMAHL
jgi:hypothetical protein